MPTPVVRILLCLAAAASLATAEERYTVYLPQGMEATRVGKLVAPMFQGRESVITYTPLAQTCATPEEAKRHAHAIEAGVSQLPSLVIMDESGPFAVIPLQTGLTEKDLERARSLATAPGRRDAHQKRLLSAHIYLLCARTALCTAEDTEGIAAAVKECRAVMENGLCDKEQRQFLGLHCLYPLLMRQYTHAYKGAHTPYTEAKLLEAIAALEAARDIDRDSPNGRKAHEERERLRSARIKSREFE